ncbi:hypothetical protein AGR1B_pa0050 [Agrobacterium fabacearum S56]|nr:hypothetical protein AGR1B_pa0050 [Agrobacterium fabacearum S56]
MLSACTICKGLAAGSTLGDTIRGLVSAAITTPGLATTYIVPMNMTNKEKIGARFEGVMVLSCCIPLNLHSERSFRSKATPPLTISLLPLVCL